MSVNICEIASIIDKKQNTVNKKQKNRNNVILSNKNVTVNKTVTAPTKTVNNKNNETKNKEAAEKVVNYLTQQQMFQILVNYHIPVAKQTIDELKKYSVFEV